MKINYLLLALFLMPVFFSCKKKINCPGFNYPELEHWVPYQVNQSISFKNDSRNATLKIASIFKTPSQKGPADGGFSGVICRRGFILKGELKIDGITKPYEVYISMELRGLDGLDIAGSFMVAESLNFNGVDETKGFFKTDISQWDINNLGYFSVPESKSLGGVQYSLLQTLVYKSVDRSFDFLYVARDKGMVGFRLKGEAGDFVIN